MWKCFEMYRDFDASNIIKARPDSVNFCGKKEDTLYNRESFIIALALNHSISIWTNIGACRYELFWNIWCFVCSKHRSPPYCDEKCSANWYANFTLADIASESQLQKGFMFQHTRRASNRKWSFFICKVYRISFQILYYFLYWREWLIWICDRVTAYFQREILLIELNSHLSNDNMIVEAFTNETFFF